MKQGGDVAKETLPIPPKRTGPISIKDILKEFPATCANNHVMLYTYSNFKLQIVTQLISARRRI